MTENLVDAKTKQKAWMVLDESDDEDGLYIGDIVWADTRGKAISQVFQQRFRLALSDDYIDYRARRVRSLDGQPHQLSDAEYESVGMTIL